MLMSHGPFRNESSVLYCTDVSQIEITEHSLLVIGGIAIGEAKANGAKVLQ